MNPEKREALVAQIKDNAFEAVVKQNEKSAEENLRTPERIQARHPDDYAEGAAHGALLALSLQDYHHVNFGPLPPAQVNAAAVSLMMASGWTRKKADAAMEAHGNQFLAYRSRAAAVLKAAGQTLEEDQ